MIRVPYAPPEGYSDDEVNGDFEEIQGKSADSFQSEIDMKFSHEKNAQWLSSAWKLDPFNEKLPPSERKAEWRKFRDQFNRISDCKIPVGPVTKLKGMKIHAGEYLLNIIEMQEAAIGDSVDDIYVETIKLVDRYFDSTCNKTQERIKFRQMKQRTEENFTDWVLRLEAQSKFCDFEEEQRKEEFLQALIGNSVSELAEKLYEASSFFNNDIAKMIQHGHHLDIMRIKKVDEKVLTSIKAEPYEETTRPIMWVGNRETLKNRGEDRYKPYRSYKEDRGNDYRPNSGVPLRECDQCGRRHVHNRCPSFRSKCNKCGNVGHWAEKCRSNLRTRKWEDDKKDNMFKHAVRINKVDDIND